MFFLPIIFFIISFKQISKPISKVFPIPLIQSIVTYFDDGRNHIIFYLTYFFYCFLGRGKHTTNKKNKFLLGKCLILIGKTKLKKNVFNF